MCRRSVAAAVVALGVCAGLPNTAPAQDPLRVERDAGTESCPDAATLAERVQAIRGRPATAGAGYDVHFARDGRVFSAELRAEGGASVRKLESQADDCEPLARATGVTLALLFDSTPEPAKLEPLAAASAPPAEPLPPPPAAKPPAEPSERVRLGLALGAGLASAIVRPSAPVFLGEIGLRHAALRFGAGAAWIPTQRLAFGPGAVDVGLIAGQARACWTGFRRSWLQIDGCAGILLGSVTAEPHGIRGAESRARLFAALPLELAFGQDVGQVSWELGLSLVLAFRRNQFEIEGLGKVYDTPSFAGLFSVRIAGWFAL